MFFRNPRLSALALATVVCLVLACAVGFTPGTGLSIAGAIGGVTTTITFGPAGIVVTQSNETVKQAAALRLFDQDPVDRPGTAQMTLLSSDVKVTPLDVAKALSPLEGEPINGEATVRFSIASGQAAEMCDQAVFLAEYDLDVQNNAVSIPGETADVSKEALDVLVTNDITVCMDVTADFEAKLVMDAFDLEFGESDLTASPTPTPIPSDNANDNDNSSTPDNSPGAEVMAGCWNLEFSNIYSPDPTVNTGDSDGTMIYEFDEQGRVASIWAFIPGDAMFGTDHVMELFRITKPSVGIMAEAIRSASQSTAFSAFGTQLDIIWDVSMFGVTSCEIPTREAYADVHWAISATPSGLPINRFDGEFTQTQTGRYTDPSRADEEVEKAWYADVVGTRVDCPDPSLENVESQEEYVAELCD